MPSSYSPLLRFEEIGAGEQSGLWGDTTNKNIGQLIEQAIAGVTTISLTGGAGTYTLSALNGALDESRAAVLKFIGNPTGGKNIVIPTSTKLYVVRNDCGRTLVIKTAAQVGGVTLLTGEATLVFCDGTNAVAGIATVGVGPTTVANGGTGATGFGVGGFIKSPGTTGTLFASQFVSLASDITGNLPVVNGGTGASSFIQGSILRGNGGSQFSPLVGTSLGQVATWDGTQWVAASPASTIPNGVITLWSGSSASIPVGWLLCNGANGTPDLRDRFVVGAGNSYAVGATGGSADAVLVSHTHSFSGSGSGSGTTTSALGTHTHTFGTSTSVSGTHNHVVNDPGHTHVTPSQAGVGSGAPGSPSIQQSAGSQNTGSSFTGITLQDSGLHSHTLSGTTDASASLAHTHTVGISVSISGTTGSAGSSGSGANLPPYYALCYIMKA